MQLVKSLLDNAAARMDTKQKLAEYLGVSRQAMFRWETDRGAPGAEHVWKLLSLVYMGKMQIIAPIFDSYIKEKNAAKEFS